ncbi:hypothetical protein SLEP1_g30649 [Rubroshorea leprosula]|uniref:Uncharacterized protein n=1 Tax=Rubroshorea leprosula TaxID=152421 RepID=A0AAV5K6E6_9ROSI|nr:hypothetical protein SLEP1_g30649 [Rubroshorea leprosula]
MGAQRLHHHRHHPSSIIFFPSPAFSSSSPATFSHNLASSPWPLAVLKTSPVWWRSVFLVSDPNLSAFQRLRSGAPVIPFFSPVTFLSRSAARPQTPTVQFKHHNPPRFSPFLLLSSSLGFLLP